MDRMSTFRPLSRARVMLRVTVPPAISLRVCGTVEKLVPGPAVLWRKVTTVMWLNDIRFTQTQVGGLRLVFERDGSV